MKTVHPALERKIYRLLPRDSLVLKIAETTTRTKSGNEMVEVIFSRYGEKYRTKVSARYTGTRF